MSKEQTDLLPEGYAETMPANWADVLRSRAEATYLDDTKGTRDLLTATAIYLSAASPSPAGGEQGVTDEMVERAARAEYTRVILPSIMPEFRQRELDANWRSYEAEARRWLTAALSSQAQTTGGVE